MCSIAVIAAAVQRSHFIGFCLSGAVVTSSMMYMQTGKVMAGIMSSTFIGFIRSLILGPLACWIAI